MVYTSYGSYFYFSSLSLRKAADRLSDCFIKRNQVSIWNWIQKHKRKSLYVVDEIVIKVGSEYIWIWVVIEPESKEILGMSVSKERNMFVVERCMLEVMDEHGKHPVSTDGGTWYPQACKFLKLKHHIHSL